MRAVVGVVGLVGLLACSKPSDPNDRELHFDPDNIARHANELAAEVDRKNSAPSASPTPAPERASLPNVSHLTTDGVTWSRQSLSDKVVLVYFWATWNKPNIRDMPNLVSVYDRYKDRGLVLLAVLTDSVDDATLKAFQSEHHMTFPIVRATPDLLESYGHPSALPMTFIFDRGHQAFKHIGSVSNDQLDGLLAPLFAQK